MTFYAMQADSTSSGKWQPLFDDSCNQLLSFEPNWPAVLLMRGLLQLLNKKTGLVQLFVNIKHILILLPQTKWLQKLTLHGPIITACCRHWLKWTVFCAVSKINIQGLHYILLHKLFSCYAYLVIRPSKRNLQDSLNASRPGEYGWMKSLTRKHLLDILLTKKDEEAIQVCCRPVFLWCTVGDWSLNMLWIINH